MNLEQPASQLFLGGAVGLISAVVAMALQMRLQRRNQRLRGFGLPGCVLMVSGCLGGVGLLVAAASLLLTGGIKLAITPGIGVLVGFFVGSALMIVLRLIPFRGQASERSAEPMVE